MFCNGDSSHLGDVFDKSKQDHLNELPSQPNIEIRSLYQALLQRVTQIEKTQSSFSKTIQSLQKTITDLKSENTSLSNKLEKLQSEFTSHATGCETTRKNTKAHLKRLDGLDFTEYLAVNKNVKDELSRISKVCVSLQKQISDAKNQKSYASITSPSRSPTLEATSHLTEQRKITCVVDNGDRAVIHDPIHEHTELDRPMSTATAKGTATRLHKDNAGARNNTSDSNSTKAKNMVTSPDNAMHDNDGHHKTNHITEVRSISSESARLIAQTSKDTRNAGQQPHDLVTMTANTSGINHDILPQKGCNDDSDIFEGVTYKRNARYYISGISNRSTQPGMLNFLKNKGISVSHCVLFKPKHPGSRRNAKINIALSDATAVETPGFWPHGVSCRPWLSVKDWENKIARNIPTGKDHPSGENWENEQP